MHFGQHRVGFGLGEKAAALDRRQLRRIAEHQHRHAERHQVAAKLGVDHRAFVDDDQLRLRGRRLVPQFEIRHLLAALARPVDQAMDRARAGAALAAHHHRGLAGEGGEMHLAVDALGDVAGERGLAGAGIAEQPEYLARAARGLFYQPIGNRLERGILMRRENRHGNPRRICGDDSALPNTLWKQRPKVPDSAVSTLTARHPPAHQNRAPAARHSRLSPPQSPQ